MRGRFSKPGPVSHGSSSVSRSKKKHYGPLCRGHWTNISRRGSDSSRNRRRKAIIRSCIPRSWVSRGYPQAFDSDGLMRVAVLLHVPHRPGYFMVRSDDLVGPAGLCIGDGGEARPQDRHSPGGEPFHVRAIVMAASIIAHFPSDVVIARSCQKAAPEWRCRRVREQCVGCGAPCLQAGQTCKRLVMRGGHRHAGTNQARSSLRRGDWAPL